MDSNAAKRSLKESIEPKKMAKKDPPRRVYKCGNPILRPLGYY